MFETHVLKKTSNEQLKHIKQLKNNKTMKTAQIFKKTKNIIKTIKTIKQKHQPTPLYYNNTRQFHQTNNLT